MKSYLVVCSPKYYKKLRESFNEDLFLRNAIDLKADSFIPTEMLYIEAIDAMFEINDLKDVSDELKRICLS